MFLVYIVLAGGLFARSRAAGAAQSIPPGLAGCEADRRAFHLVVRRNSSTMTFSTLVVGKEV
jgi:hypothetical protein